MKFEEFLQEKHEEYPELLDDDLSDAFEEWLEQLSTDEIIKYANECIEKQKAELKQIVLEDIPHQYQNRLLTKLK